MIKRFLDRMAAKTSFRKMLVWLFMGVCLIPIAVLGLFSYTSSSENVQERIVTDSLVRLDKYESNITEVQYVIRQIAIELSINRDVVRQMQQVERTEIEAMQAEQDLRRSITSDTYDLGIFSAAFISRDGRAYTPLRDYDVGDLQPYLDFIEGDIVYEWQEPEVINGRKVMPLWRKIRTNDTTTVGMLVVNLSLSSMQVSYPYKTSEDEIFLVLNDAGTVCFSSDVSLVGKAAAEIYQVREEGCFDSAGRDFSCDWNGTRYWGLGVENQETGFRFVRMLPWNDAFRETNNILVLTILCCLLCGVLCLAVSLLLGRSITDPLTGLIANLREKTEIEGEEIQSNQSYAALVNQLQETVDSYAFELQRKKDAEMNNLIFQIKPHYLYNTLFSVICLIDEGDNEGATQMLSALSEYFRIIISKGRLTISVREEIQHISKYLDIQRYRYRNIASRIDVDPGIMPCMIPKIVLQPIVENSFLHGLRDRGNGAEITVTGRAEGDDLIIQVTDNGRDATPEVMEELNDYLQGKTVRAERKFGIGIKNVHERIVMHSGENYGLSYARVGEKTVATLRIRRMECDA